MDEQRFDDLARQLGAATTRRTLLRTAIAGLTGIAGLGRLSSVSAAKCRSGDNVCSNATDCCSHQCLPQPGRNRNICCAVGSEICHAACKPIIEYQTDVDNCGSCGHVCPDVQTCRKRACTAGVCGSAPDPNQNGQSCDDEDKCTINDVCDTGSCGGTEITCGAVAPCQVDACDPRVGQCSVQNAPDGTFCTDGNACTLNDNCQSGVCVGTPVVCDVCHHCAGGSCQNDDDDTVTTGGSCCGGAVIDTQNDFNNCGTCGHACASGQHCAGGTCKDQTCRGLDEFCSDSNSCCSDICLGAVCICVPSLPAPAFGGPCTEDKNCCQPGYCFGPSGTGVCTCLEIGLPCEHESQCCTKNCNKLPFSDSRVCSPFD